MTFILDYIGKLALSSELLVQNGLLFQEILAQRSATANLLLENQKNNQTAAQPSNFQSCITNLIVVIGFAAFAFTVKYVMKTTASEAE